MQVCPHPDGWIWVHSLCNPLLRKGGMWVRGTLKQEEQENSFGQYSSLSKPFEIRILGDKQVFV
jgi:hypothetical protein